MAHGHGRSGGPRPRQGRTGSRGQRRSLFRRRKVCKFCADKIDDINYKDVKLIGPFVPERGQDPAAPDLGHLRDAPAEAADGDQAGTADRAAART